MCTSAPPPASSAWCWCWLQLARLMARDGMAEADALARVRAQMALKRKARMAHIVLDNDGSPAELAKQVHAAHGPRACAQPTLPPPPAHCLSLPALGGGMAQFSAVQYSTVACAAVCPAPCITSHGS